jgi:hypothetical protein
MRRYAIILAVLLASVAYGDQLVQRSSSTYPPSFYLQANGSDANKDANGVQPTAWIHKQGGSYVLASSVVQDGNGLYHLGDPNDWNTLGDLWLKVRDPNVMPLDGKFKVVSFDPYTDANAMGYAATNDSNTEAALADVQSKANSIKGEANTLLMRLGFTLDPNIGKLQFDTNGFVKSDLYAYGGTFLTGNTGKQIAAFQTFFEVGSVNQTAASYGLSGDVYPLSLLILNDSNSNHSKLNWIEGEANHIPAMNATLAIVQGEANSIPSAMPLLSLVQGEANALLPMPAVLSLVQGEANTLLPLPILTTLVQGEANSLLAFALSNRGDANNIYNRIGAPAGGGSLSADLQQDFTLNYPFWAATQDEANKTWARVGSYLDANVGSRMATFTYTAPPSSSANASAVLVYLLDANYNRTNVNQWGGASLPTTFIASNFVAAPTASAIDTQLSGVHGAGAWGPSAGSGPLRVQAWVQDGNGTALQAATVRMVEGINNYSGTSDANGLVTFSLGAASYATLAIKSGYSFTPSINTVSLDSNITLTMTAIALPVATIPGTCAVYFDCYDANFSAAVGLSFTFTMTSNPDGSGSAIPTTAQGGVSDAQGRVSVILLQGATYKIGYGSAVVRQIVLPKQTSYQTPDFRY